MLLKKITSKNNVLFFSIISVVANIAIIMSIISINLLTKALEEKVIADLAAQQAIINKQRNIYGNREIITNVNAKVSVKFNQSFAIVGSLVAVVFLIFNLFLFFGVKKGITKFIKVWIVFRLFIAVLAIIGAIIYTIMVPINLPSFISSFIAFPPIILTYCFVGFYLFEISTVYIYLKQLREEIINIHLKPRHAGVDYI